MTVRHVVRSRGCQCARSSSSCADAAWSGGRAVRHHPREGRGRGDEHALPGVVVGFSGAPPARAVSALTDSQGDSSFGTCPKAPSRCEQRSAAPDTVPPGFFWSGLASDWTLPDGGYGHTAPADRCRRWTSTRASDSPMSSSECGNAGSIDGTVVDEAVSSLVNVLVAASRRSSDGRLLQGPSTSTDDRGAYHLGTLTPGDYLVVVPQMQALMPASTADALAVAAPTDRTVPAGDCQRPVARAPQAVFPSATSGSLPIGRLSISRRTCCLPRSADRNSSSIRRRLRRRRRRRVARRRSPFSRVKRDRA